jgi:hypothetical protein
MAKLNELGGDFELPPEGKHPGTSVEFVDLGLQPGKFGPSRQADATFELIGETTADGKPMLAFKRVFNLSPRSKNFRDMVRSLTGLHNIADVDTRDLLGKSCELVIEHVLTEDGSTFANVECRPWRGSKDAPAPESLFVFFSLAPTDFFPGDLDNLSERRREKIKASETFKALIADSKGKPPAKIIGDGLPGAPMSKPGKSKPRAAKLDDGDPIPF